MLAKQDIAMDWKVIKNKFTNQKAYTNIPFTIYFNICNIVRNITPGTPNRPATNAVIGLIPI